MRVARLLPFLVLIPFFAAAQYSGPRLFLDLPNIYFTAPDVERIGNRLGAGAETAFNLATHWSTVRVGGGAAFTADPQSDDLGASFVTAPYALLEAGVGMYRSNGNKCAKTRQNAFTAMARVGMRYTFDTRDLAPAEGNGIYGMQFAVGAEFGYFFIRDIFKNYEVFLRATYYPEPKIASADLGFKLFLNLRAPRN